MSEQEPRRRRADAGTAGPFLRRRGFQNDLPKIFTAVMSGKFVGDDYAHCDRCLVSARHNGAGPTKIIQFTFLCLIEKTKFAVYAIKFCDVGGTELMPGLHIGLGSNYQMLQSPARRQRFELRFADSKPRGVRCR